MKNLEKKVVNYLKENIDKKFTAKEIAEFIMKTYPKEVSNQKTKNKHSDINIINQVAAEIGARYRGWQTKGVNIDTIKGWPRKFFWKSEVNLNKNAEPAITDENGKTRQLKEKDIYPLLCNYYYSEYYSIYPKIINASTSSNDLGKGANKWLHPDVVAVEIIAEDWDPKIKECVKLTGNKKLMFYSFEVKTKLNSTNIRESFFQAVSNSSWANYGFLVTTEIEEGKNNQNMIELYMLCSLHGIGLIEINIEKPEESEIIYNAIKKPEVDWETCNRMLTQNKDFKEFIEKTAEILSKPTNMGKEININTDRYWDIPRNAK